MTSLPFMVPLIAALVGATGCYRTTIDEVRVRDPREVSVLRGDGTVSLPEGREPAAAWHQDGAFYRLLAERDAAGRLSLRCSSGCTPSWFARIEPPVVTLMDTDGVIRSKRVASFDAPSTFGEGREGMEVWVPGCVRAARRSCEVGAPTLLATHWDNVISIRRRELPDKLAGGVLIGVGALFVLSGAALTAALVVNEPGRPLSPGLKALPAVLGGSVGLAVTGDGIWLLAPPFKERVLYPPP